MIGRLPGGAEAAIVTCLADMAFRLQAAF